MRFLLQTTGAARRQRTFVGPRLSAIVTSLIVACCGCAVTPVSPKPVETPSAALREASGPVIQASSTTSVIQAQHLEVSEPGELAAGRAPMAAATQKSEAVPTPSPSSALTLDQAVNTTLMADPKLRAGLETIQQANADLRTSSLPPNPTLVAQGQYLPLRPFTPEKPGGPSEFDVQVGYPIDWFVFGKRAAAIASARLGVRHSEADYADLIRQRVTTTATAFYDVLEAKSLLELARQDTENLTRLEAVTREAVNAGGRPVVEFKRIRLDMLKSQQNLRESRARRWSSPRPNCNRSWAEPTHDPSFDVAGNLDAPLTAEPLLADEAFALAQENRPDIQSLRIQVSKARGGYDCRAAKGFSTGHAPVWLHPAGSSRRLVPRTPTPGSHAYRDLTFVRPQPRQPGEGAIRGRAKLLQFTSRTGRSPCRDRGGGPEFQHGLPER